MTTIWTSTYTLNDRRERVVLGCPRQEDWRPRAQRPVVARLSAAARSVCFIALRHALRTRHIFQRSYARLATKASVENTWLNGNMRLLIRNTLLRSQCVRKKLTLTLRRDRTSAVFRAEGPPCTPMAAVLTDLDPARTCLRLPKPRSQPHEDERADERPHDQPPERAKHRCLPGPT